MLQSSGGESEAPPRVAAEVTPLTTWQLAHCWLKISQPAAASVPSSGLAAGVFWLSLHWSNSEGVRATDTIFIWPWDRPQNSVH